MAGPHAFGPQHRVTIGLSAVVIAVTGDIPRVLTTSDGGVTGLPFGSFDPVGHRTFELALRDFVTAQTGFALGYVEQLYTFGDLGREAPLAQMADGGALSADRVVSVGYLALTPPDPGMEQPDARWRPWHLYFPYEDSRADGFADTIASIRSRLLHWCRPDANPALTVRIDAAFPADPSDWNEEAALDRYELLYEAGLVAESSRDQPANDAPGLAASAVGQPMRSDHRRILATAISRLRAKMKYRPVVFDLAAPHFTLGELQRLCEAVGGLMLHKQNFRRSVQNSGLVAPLAAKRLSTGGRPAQVFERVAMVDISAARGLALPRRKRTPR